MSVPLVVALVAGDGGEIPRAFNRAALAALVGASVVAFLALFSLPLLMDLGLSFWVGFWTIGAVEFLTAIVAGLAISRLYVDREGE